MNLSNIVVDPASVVRAYSRAYKQLDSQFNGRETARFKNEVQLLKSSCTLFLTSCMGEEVEGIETIPSEYGGMDALIVLTPNHKFMLVTEHASSAVFSVVNINVR